MRWILLTLSVVLLTFGSQAGADDKKTTTAPTKAKKKILVITESVGFVHDVVNRKKNVDPKSPDLSLAERTMKELAEKSGDFDVVLSQNAREAITAENLKNFDAVFFYTTGDLKLSDTQKADLLQFVKSGKGFAGSHCATDTYYNWPEYGNLIGAYFDGHPWHQKVNIIVEDKKNPATKHLGDSFTITDEIYEFKAPYDREKLHVLMHLDTTNLKMGKRADRDNAIAWIHEYGKGRVFYTALGHREEVWKDERFQKHMIGGLRYVLGLEDADATPSGKPKTDK